MGNRTAEAGMIEDRGRQGSAEQRIAGDDAFGLTADPLPKLVDWCDWFLVHGRPPPGGAGPKYRPWKELRQRRH
jgi:hypothetical protein